MILTKFITYRQHMKANKVVVTLLAFCVVMLALVSNVAAAELANDTVVWVSGVPVSFNGYFTEQPAVFVGESLPVKVSFVAAKNAEDVRVEVEIDGYENGLEARTERFDIINGVRYTKTMSIDVPFDLEDELSDSFDVTVKIYDDHDKSVREFTVKVQRESYQLEMLSIDTTGSAQAGKSFPVELVLKNRGMRDLEDVFVTARIPALGIERRMYFKDVFALDESCDDDECNDDSLYGKIDLMIPSNAAPGVYTLEITARNDDVVSSATKQIAVENTIPSESVIPTMSVKTFAVGEEVVYEILLVNPTDNVKIYRATADGAEDLSVSVDPTLIALSAGSSKSLMVKVNAAETGKYRFGVNVFSESGDLIRRVELTANVRGSDYTSGDASGNGKIDNTVLALTIVLAVIFVVLLIILITLLSKKPQKTEEFGESYY